METFKKQHSLAIFIGYVILVNFRPNHLVLDGIVLASLFGYVLFDKYLNYKVLPDIRGEVESQLAKQKADIEKILIAQNTRIVELETQIKEANSSVNKVINMKNLNSATSVRF
jgi:hypothetical protein